MTYVPKAEVVTALHRVLEAADSLAPHLAGDHFDELKDAIKVGAAVYTRELSKPEPSDYDKREERRTKAMEAATGAFVSLCHKLEGVVDVGLRVALKAEAEAKGGKKRS